MIKKVPFKKQHLDLMMLRDHEDRLFANEGIVAALEGSIAEVAIADGIPVCAYGIAPYLGDMAEVWLIPSVYTKDYAVKLARDTREWLEEMHIDLKIRRMETLCLDDDLHNRWMAFLGFECEGVKRQYYNGVDYKMWGRIWE